MRELEAAALRLRLLSSGLSSQSGFRRQIYRLHIVPFDKAHGLHQRPAVPLDNVRYHLVIYR